MDEAELGSTEGEFIQFVFSFRALERLWSSVVHSPFN